MQTSSRATTSRLARWAAPVALSAVLLSGCASAESDSDPSAEAIPTPTQVSHPDATESCTVEVATSEGGDYPDRATVACGDRSQEIDGEFRHRVLNHYDPATTGGIESVVVVGEERRVWMEHPDGTCMIRWSEGEEPTDCEVSTRSDNGAANAPNPTPSSDPAQGA